MNLSSMRDIDTTDPIGGLGPRVTPAPAPAPAPVRRPDGIVVGPDGKLSTDLPPPAVPENGWPQGVPVWPFPSKPAAPTPDPEPGAHGFLKVGDRVRLLNPSKWNLHQPPGLASVITQFLSDKMAAHKNHCVTADGWYFWTAPHLIEGVDWERAE